MSNGPLSKGPLPKGLLRILTATLLLGAVTYVTCAQTSNRTVSDTSRVFNADPVVVTGQTSPTSASRSIHRVKVLDSTRIRGQQAVSLNNVLATEMNVRLAQDNILGTGMSLQGLGGQNVKILIDGIPVIGRVNGNIDLSQVLLSTAERIEIVEGPMSVRYGTDALGGVVNVVTKKSFSPAIRFNGESVGAYNVDAMLRTTLDAFTLTLDGGRNFFDGWSEDEDARKRSAQWKPREQYAAHAGVAWTDSVWTLQYDARFFHELILNRGEPRAPYGETAFDDRYITQRWTHAVSVGVNPFEGQHLDVIAAYSDYGRRKNSIVKNLVTLEEQLITEPGAQDTTSFTNAMLRATYGFGVARDAVPAAAVDATLGLDANLDNTHSGRIAGADASMQDVALFGELRYRPADWLTIQPALRAAWNSTYGAPITPSLNVLMRPASNWTLRASYARGFRAPSLRELHLYFVDINHDIVGNPDLLAERSNNLHASAQKTFSWESGVVGVEPSLFYNGVENLITLAQIDATKFTYVNVGEYTTAGIGLDVSLRMDALDARVGFLATGRSVASNPMSFGPEARASLQYTDEPLGLSWSAFYKFTGASPNIIASDDGTISEGRLAAYHMLDFSVGKRFLEDRLGITVGMKNVFNVRNVNSSGLSGGAHVSDGATSPVSYGRTVAVTIDLRK